LVAIKDKNGKTLISQDEQLNRFAEHYKELASDATSHSLDENYWKNVLGSSQIFAETLDINHPITMSEIKSTIRDRKNNKAPEPDGIPTEFFKAFFKNNVSSDDHSNTNTVDNNYSDLTVLNIYYYFLIKFGMVIYLTNGIQFLLFPFLKKEISQIAITIVVFHLSMSA